MKHLLLRASALLALLLLPEATFAQAPAEIWVHCGNLPGCGPGFREYASSVLQLLGTNLPAYAYAIGVLFIMIGGAYMVLSAGREDWVTKGKNTIMWAVIGIAATSFSESAVTFLRLEVSSRVPDADFVLSVNSTLISTIFDLLSVSIFGVAVYCGMLMVLAGGKEDQFSKGRQGLFWCAVGAIAINLARAIATAFSTL
jgi:hypothetical protein